MGKAKLKPLKEQVTVITGASSGIGLATAKRAAPQGAREWKSSGGDARFIHCDVSKREEVDEWGRTNQHGVFLCRRIDQASEEDSRLWFESNFWGVDYGAFAALSYLRQESGALINFGSEIPGTVAPLQGKYSARKHALEGFAHALRVKHCFRTP